MEKSAELYEIGYLVKDSLRDEDVLSFSENLRNTITEKGGLVISEGKPKKQNLAYPIKKETLATFNWLGLTMKPQTIEEIDKYLKENSDVLRFIIIKTEKEKAPKPSILKPKKIRRKKQITTSISVPKIEESDKEKEEIKEEEIDKKIEELLGD